MTYLIVDFFSFLGDNVGMSDLLTVAQRSYITSRAHSNGTNLGSVSEKDKIVASPKVLDLFAGAGGLSEGFIKTGCEIVGHIEMDEKACDTLVTRMVYHALNRMGKLFEYKKYILGRITRDEIIEKYHLQKERDSVICAKVGGDNYKKLIQEIKARLGSEKLDIVVGGPPCQAYSYIGRARDEHNMRRDGRNFLYRYYVEFLKALKPKIFVFENVPGLESAGNGRYLADMRKLMKEAGYTTDCRIINAVNYGVPQNRKRIILVGWSSESRLENYPIFSTLDREYITGDFFDDLPKIQAGEGQQLVEDFSSGNKLLKKLGIINPKIDFLMDHVSRTNNTQDLEIYRLGIQAKKRGENLKYNNLPKRLRSHKNSNSFLDRFKVVDFAAKGSHTVVAHIAKDGHFYIHPDPKQNRSLTVREAARLQTFPDDYKFEGTRGSQFRQIGNAVPPMLSKIIATELVKYV
jgi:DNA (cytosine-5)-methyltransferase 1